MKLFLLLFISAFFTTAQVWKTDFNEAKAEALKTNKIILLNFSGSDWCSPCIQFKSKIFESQIFNTYANDRLVLVNADFPRKKKNKLTVQQKKMNEALAEKYNPEGKFPYTVLLSPTGKIIKQWDGLPDLSPAAFTEQIKVAVNAEK